MSKKYYFISCRRQLALHAATSRSMQSLKRNLPESDEERSKKLKMEKNSEDDAREFEEDED